MQHINQYGPEHLCGTPIQWIGIVDDTGKNITF